MLNHRVFGANFIPAVALQLDSDLNISHLVFSFLPVVDFFGDVLQPCVVLCPGTRDRRRWLEAYALQRGLELFESLSHYNLLKIAVLVFPARHPIQAQGWDTPSRP